MVMKFLFVGGMSIVWALLSSMIQYFVQRIGLYSLDEAGDRGANNFADGAAMTAVVLFVYSYRGLGSLGYV